MSKTDKLKMKLVNGSITAPELRTLLNQLGWELKRVKGSHEQWRSPSHDRFTLATHRKDLKEYQVQEIRKLLGL